MGESVGEAAGLIEGENVGESVGAAEGLIEGDDEGESVGEAVGFAEGDNVGKSGGEVVGLVEGGGHAEGDIVWEGDTVGESVDKEKDSCRQELAVHSACDCHVS